jgi:hypothetical protein
MRIRCFALLTEMLYSTTICLLLCFLHCIRCFQASHYFKDLFEMLHENKQVVPEWLTQLMEQTGRRGGAGGAAGGPRKFGGKDVRKGGYGAHSGGRGGMINGGLEKLGRFQQQRPGQAQHPHQQQQTHFGGGGAPQQQFPQQHSQQQQQSHGGSFPQGGASRQQFHPQQGGQAGRSFQPAAAASQQ